MHISDLDFFEDLTIWCDKEGTILKANKLFFKTIQKPKQEVIGKHQDEFYTSDHPCNPTEDTEIFEETLYFKKEEQTRFYKTKKESFLQHNQSIIKLTRRDITEYKKYLTIYHDHKKLLKHIASGTHIKTILKEIIKSVENRNPSMICSILILDETKTKLLTGAAPSLPDFYNEKLNGMSIGEKVGSCGAAVYLKKRVVVEDISTHENWKYAKNLAKRANVHACWSQPIFSSTNEILGSFAIYYDKPQAPSEFDNHLIEDIASITGIAIEKHLNHVKVKKEQDQRIQQEQLFMHRSKQAMMGEMLENIAHQWRQPLSVISTYATGVLMKKKYEISTPEEETEAFDVINLNAQYLSDTIEDFRTYFMSTPHKTKFSLLECLEQTNKLIASRLKLNKIKLLADIEDIEISTYKNELTQVFMNIFNNSADVLAKMPEKERFISLDVYQDNDYAILKVIDSGNGVDEKIIKRIFEPYFTTKHQNYGTGIGLYMCQEIIEKHMKGLITAQNNDFTFKNRTYNGLEFIIKIPLE